MEYYTLLILTCAVLATSAWSVPFYPVQRAPLRITRYAPHPHHSVPVHETHRERPKRDDYDGYGHDGHGHDRRSSGVTGPIHTFVKTDKNANYKWGVRHHVGNKYAS